MRARWLVKTGLSIVIALALAPSAAAQPAGAGQGWMGEFEHASRQLLQLADAIPADKFAWRPAPGVRSINELYMHIAIGNYLTFTAEQRALLGIILEYRNAIISRIRPGVSSQQVMDEARVAMDPVFARWTFARPEHEQAAREMVRTGGGVFSHPVGMAVHDDGGRPNPLRVGQVFSVDPQLWIKDAGGQSLVYMRYEDVGVVTDSGFENFTAFMPTTLDELERAVRLKGIVQDYPPSAMPWRAP